MSEHIIKENPLVTVLISTYNRPQYVCQALESILNQTYRNLEIFLIRDGGTPVKHLIEKYDDPRLVFIDRDENRGLPASFNQALRQATGKYVCYLGDDDIFYPHHVETLVNALEGQDHYEVAYTDLYKAHCRIEKDGTRTVLAKNVEISRDFDRTAMLQFNHVLHCSMMHTRDLLEKTGLYNEKISVLIDWDLSRRMCFFSDFLHVHEITGEFYASTDINADRISVQKRKNVQSYILNVLTIRSQRPAKPWPYVRDLSLVLLADRVDNRIQECLRQIWSHTFYPHRIYLPMPESELDKLDKNTAVPNIIGVPVNEGMTDRQKMDIVMECCDGEFIGVLNSDWTIGYDEVAWIEKSVFPLLENDDPNQAYYLVGSKPSLWGIVTTRSQMRRARKMYPQLSIQQSLNSSGIKLDIPDMLAWPFQMENYVTAAALMEKKGKWLDAAHIYQKVPYLYGNDLWMAKRRANALYHSKKYTQAIEAIAEHNSLKPQVSTLLIEARSHRKIGDHRTAVKLLEKARGVLEGSEIIHAG